MINNKCKFFGSSLLVLLFTTVFFSMPASAAIPQTATDYALRAALEKCYVNEAFVDEVNVDGPTLTATSIIGYNEKASIKYLLPNGNSLGMDTIGCRELIFGNSSWPGILKAYGDVDVDFADPVSIVNVLANYLQYDAGEKVSQNCFTINMTAEWDINTNDVKTRKVSSSPLCVPLDSAGKIDQNVFNYSTGTVSVAEDGIFVSSRPGHVVIIFQLNDNYDMEMIDVPFSVNDDWASFVEKIRTEINKRMIPGRNLLCASWTPNGQTCAAGFIFGSGDSVDDTIQVDSPTRYTMYGNYSLRASRALGKIFGSRITALNNVDAISLYQSYLNDAVSSGGLQILCDATEDVSRAAGYNVSFTMIKDGGKSSCYAKILNRAAKYNPLSSRLIPDVSGRSVDIESILNRLTSLVKEANLTGAQMATISNVETNTVSENSELTTGEMCYNSGIEGSSWILCPTMENMEYTASSLDNAIEDWLSVNTNIYDRNSGTYTAWGLVRDIANIVIIVILIVVVISQLTGYGIDNYGIKRILPRLIMMAVLLNLSFYICELAIDASNILGVGLRDLFGNAGKLILNGKSDSNFINEVIKALFVAGGLAGASIPTIITGVTAVSALGVGSTIMVAVIILLSLLVALIGIFMFFFSLGARTIIIIFCVAAAPLAFVAYVLPNTQRMFKQWWSLFKAALIIFPICGALGGVSYMIKAIVLQTNNPPFSLLVVALISPYIVFFLLPALIRGAISSFGRIGAALTSLGGAFRGGVQSTAKAVQGTAGYKSTMQEGQMAMMRRRVGLGADGKLTERGRKILARAQEKGGGRLRLYSARMAAIQKDQDAMAAGGAALRNLAQKNTEITDEQAAAATTIFGNKFGGQREAFFANDFIAAAQHARETNDTSQLDSVVAAMTQSGMEGKDIAWMLRTAEHRGLLDLGNRQAKANWAQGIAQKYGNSFLKKDPELRHNYGSGNRIALTRRTDAQGVARNVEDTYGDYAGGWTNVNADGNVLLGENGMPRNMVMDSTDINQDEIIDMSSDAIAGAISAGTIDMASARRVLATNRVQTGDKKFMLEAVASGLVGKGVNVSEFKQDAKALANAAPGSYASMAKNMRVIGTAASGGNASMNDNQFGTWAEAAASPVAQTVRIIEGDVDLRGGRNRNGGNTGGNGANSNNQPDYDAQMDYWNNGGQ